MSKSPAHSAFTLLELVVVLAILAVITTIATRSLDSVLEQNRFDAAQRSLRDIEIAVLGDPTERASDGTRVVSGFVADMGRLPRTALSDGALSLRELWSPATPLPPFLVRPAVTANGVALADEDPEVLVAAGWRGPYLRLPLEAEDALDGWGNLYDSPNDPSPPNPDSTGYARLRGVGDIALSTVDSEIAIVRHLGSNGTRDVSDPDHTYDRDYAVSFEGRVAAELKASVQVEDENGPATGSSTDKIAVRVFSPNPADAAKIQVAGATEIMTVSATVTVPATGNITGLAVGRRPVRAYLLDAGGTTLAKSQIKYVALQPGVNFVEFTIRRP